MSTPWIAAFCVLAGTVLVLLVVVTGVVRRALAVLEAGSNEDVYTRSLRVTTTYGGLPPGTPVPDFVAASADGATVESRDLFREPSLSLLVAAGCAPCGALLADLAASAEAFDVRLLVFADDLDDAKYASLPSSITVLEQIDGSATQAFRSNAFPQAFAVGGDGVVRAVAIPSSVSDLRLLARALEGGDSTPIATQTAAA